MIQHCLKNNNETKEFMIKKTMLCFSLLMVTSNFTKTDMSGIPITLIQTASFLDDVQADHDKANSQLASDVIDKLVLSFALFKV